MSSQSMTEAEARFALRLIDEIVHVLTTTYEQIERTHLRAEGEPFAGLMTWEEFVDHLNKSVSSDS